MSERGEQLRQILSRIAGDGKGGISEQRLDEWLSQNRGRPVRLSDGRQYQLMKGQDEEGRATFRLSEVRNERSGHHV